MNERQVIDWVKRRKYRIENKYWHGCNCDMPWYEFRKDIEDLIVASIKIGRDLANKERKQNHERTSGKRNPQKIVW